MRTESITEMAARRSATPLPGATRRETFHCPLLPGDDARGALCEIVRLNPTQQLVLLGDIQRGLLEWTRQEETRQEFQQLYGLPVNMAAPQLEQWLESVFLLVYACQRPTWNFAEAASWMSGTDSDDDDPIDRGAVVQFLLYRIRSLNSEPPGLETEAAGLATLRKMPAALGALEAAYLAGPDALQKLLAGDAETTSYINHWGGIITAVAFSLLERQAKVQANATAEALITSVVELINAALNEATEGEGGAQ